MKVVDTEYLEARLLTMAEGLRGRRGELIDQEEFDRVDAALSAVRVALFQYVKPHRTEALYPGHPEHPHGMPEQWRDDGKCIWKSCHVRRFWAS